MSPEPLPKALRPADLPFLLRGSGLAEQDLFQ